ncbi:hypothetical protein BaRGS_00006323 [Batillaria attramentaria]|uniref:Uncharacterized protein n=1 Tax=Batillaria attramentaria TaxID=370345 RepID=A0ABD0LS03_9CAEN
MAAPGGSAATSPATNGKTKASFPKLEKLTIDDVCFRVLPSMGSISYGYFSIHIMNTSWFRSVFHNRDVVVANSFWFNAHIGVGLYLFGSVHLRQAPINRRILYSVFGSFLFNFGSVLFWATCKSLLPERPGLRALFGLVSGFVLLYVGKEYVDYIDSRRVTSA